MWGFLLELGLPLILLLLLWRIWPKEPPQDKARPPHLSPPDHDD
ncbi:MAG: hypothetical protein Q7S85_05620 [Rugosibacter sp.]|nr:hypothetical protein [Rugosibacter sp.]